MTQRKIVHALLLPLLLFLAACGSNSGTIPPPATGQGLEIVITGLPEGTPANVHVLGDDQTIRLTGSSLVNDLAAGTYDVLPHGVGEYAAFGGGKFDAAGGGT